MRSAIDDGCIVYGAAAKTSLKKVIDYSIEHYVYAMEL